MNGTKYTTRTVWILSAIKEIPLSWHIHDAKDSRKSARRMFSLMYWAKERLPFAV